MFNCAAIYTENKPQALPVSAHREDATETKDAVGEESAPLKYHNITISTKWPTGHVNEPLMLFCIVPQRASPSQRAIARHLRTAFPMQSTQMFIKLTDAGKSDANQAHPCEPQPGSPADKGSQVERHRVFITSLVRVQVSEINSMGICSQRLVLAI